MGAAAPIVVDKKQKAKFKTSAKKFETNIEVWEANPCKRTAPKMCPQQQKFLQYLFPAGSPYGIYGATHIFAAIQNAWR